MIRKHFKAIAAMLLKIEDLTERKRQAEDFAVIAKQSNPRFDASRFYAACGL